MNAWMALKNQSPAAPNASLLILALSLIYLPGCWNDRPGSHSSQSKIDIGTDFSKPQPLPLFMIPTPPRSAIPQTTSRPATDMSHSLSPSTPSAKAQAVLQGQRIDGITLGLFSQNPSYDYWMLLQEIADTRSTWVSFTINNYQHLHDSVKVGIADIRTSPVSRIKTTIRQARSLGLRVMLFPILLIQEPRDDDWRGNIQPRDRDQWYQAYYQFVLDYAALAQSEGVEIFSIGSEFNSMQSDTAQWQALISEVRKHYHGAITYSANWDSLGGVGFLEQLDLVGMTTYFSLSQEDDPSVDTMVQSWRAVQSDVAEWRSFHGTPLLFTEVGFPSQNGANRNPWNYFHSEEVDLAEQRDCFEAFRKAWQQDPHLNGVFFYNWFGPGGSEDTGYTPRGKPALTEIRKWIDENPTLSKESTGRKKNSRQQ